MEPMQWTKAPQQNLQTWKLVMRIVTVSVAVTAVVLLALAFTLT